MKKVSIPFYIFLITHFILSSASWAAPREACLNEVTKDIISDPFISEMLINKEVTQSEVLDEDAAEEQAANRCPCRSDPLKCCEFEGVSDCKSCIKGACGRCCGTYNVKENNAWWRCMSSCCGGTDKVDPNKGQYGGCTN